MSLEPMACDLRVVDPIKKWVEGQSENGPCRTCLLAPLSAQYAGALMESGREDLRLKLEQDYDGGNLLTIAERLDRIKDEVGEDLKKYLRSLDCLAQSWQEPAVEK